MNELDNKDLPAMPAYWYDYDSAGVNVVREQSFGLTKREHIAALAMQGLIAEDSGQRDIAKQAVKYADELLDALNT